MTVMECDVYKSVKKENYYLYVPADEGLDRVPGELLTQFGEIELALTFTLTADRRLAREDPTLVIANLQAKGFHLQLPPPKDHFRG